MKKVLVIGGGPGGYVAAIRLAQLGAEVTVVEKKRLGGTCLNVGCIPTKCLLHSAELKEELVTRGSLIGVEADNVRFNFPQLMAYKDAVTKNMTDGIAGLLKVNKVQVIYGTAVFTGKKEVDVCLEDGSKQLLNPDAIIIATGSYNAAPPIQGLADNPDCVDSTGALSLEAVPENLAVIGAGVIGLELACAYASFGSKVTIIEFLDAAMPKMDKDVIRVGINHMKKMGIEFHFSSSVQRVEKQDGKNLVVYKDKNGDEFSVLADKVLVATGRKAFTSELGLDKCGVETDRGAILVNDKMQTNIDDVYAIGDCVMGYPQLAHVASAMGEVAAENIMGADEHFDPKTTPSCLYIFPETAGVGLTEEQCIEQGIAYSVGKFPVSANAKSVIMNGGEGMVKLIIGKEYGEVLGMHMVGPRASDIIAEGALAIGSESTVDEIINTIHAHPAVTESVREAALASLGRAIHIQNRPQK